MTKPRKLIAMVQLPPPMHGAAAMNRHAIDALCATGEYDLRVIEMRFNRQVHNIARATACKLWLALCLWFRLLWLLPGAKGLYICFAPAGNAYWRDCLYVLTAKLFGVPVIVHLHGRGLPGLRRNPVLAWLQRRVLAHTTIILLGDRLRAEVATLACKTVIIPNCVDDTAFAPPLHDRWHPHERIRILWLSNLFWSKGLGSLIAACRILHQDGIAFDLTIAGANGDVTRQDLNTHLQRAGILPQSTLFGAVDAPTRADLFKHSDLFVFPSNYPNEAQPLVVLEAMAAGVPVITSDIATLPEIVRDGQTGRTCPPDDPNQLANVIKTAINMPKHTDQMRQNAYRICQDSFSKTTFARRLTTLVAKAIK
ncbi:glycosyltransferase family 4 protein [Thalassospira sp. MA62]|nr:glycosyltransferase family 4 protein [Thalassospira sp. MA62]